MFATLETYVSSLLDFYTFSSALKILTSLLIFLLGEFTDLLNGFTDRRWKGLSKLPSNLISYDSVIAIMQIHNAACPIGTILAVYCPLLFPSAECFLHQVRLLFLVKS